MKYLNFVQSIESIHSSAGEEKYDDDDVPEQIKFLTGV